MNAGALQAERSHEAPAGARGSIAVCIVVCYWPKTEQLLGLCRQLIGDGATVVLVDNTESPYLTNETLPDGCTLIALGYNSGIAHAQNTGLAEALRSGAEILAFFDQDSKVEPGFLRTLLAPLKIGEAKIVSPLYFDDVTNLELPSLRVNRLGLAKKTYRGDLSAPYPVDVIISSGTAATKEVFDIAGNFDAGLFIDFVDTEWCFRCRSRQIPIFVVPSAVMRHSIGSRMIPLGPITILFHNSTRCYYQIRNCFHLLRKRHVPILFSVERIASIMVNRICLLFFVENRREYLKAYILALHDGIRGVTGPKPA